MPRNKESIMSKHHPNTSPVVRIYGDAYAFAAEQAAKENMGVGPWISMLIRDYQKGLSFADK